MTTKHTDRLRRVIRLAEREAVSLGHAELGSEHLLLGLLREEDEYGGAPTVLTAMGIDTEQARDEITRTVPSTSGARVDSGTPALTAHAELVFGHAARVSDERIDHTIGVRHLLLGLLADDECGATQTLLHLRVDLDELRSRTWAGIAEDVSPRPAAGLEPVLSQQQLIIEMLGRISTRLDAIEARLPGHNDT